MPSKVIMVVDDGLSAQETDDLRYLLVDALGEFAVARTPAPDYVDRRYPGPDYYPDRAKKVAQVERRNSLAKKLHNSALHFVVVDDRYAMFERTLQHELGHHAAGNKPDLDTLERLLRELFR